MTNDNSSLVSDSGLAAAAGLAIGPKLRHWFGLEKGSLSAEWIGAKEFSSEDKKVFMELFLATIQKNKVADTDLVLDLASELYAMSLPQLCLKLFDSYRAVLNPGDFRQLQLEALAALAAGEFDLSVSCFHKAHDSMPNEIAPYVNLAQSYIYQKNYDEAERWLKGGLALAPNHRPLWETILFYCRQCSENELGQRDLIEKWLKSTDSWMGSSLFAECRVPGDIKVRHEVLEAHFQKGERSVSFLIEYTGTLGALGHYDKIPPILWEMERLTSSVRPHWQLLYHTAQAHLALDNIDAFKESIAKLKGHTDLPMGILEDLEQLAKNEAE